MGGITLAEAREQLGEAKQMIAAGKSPAKEKARDKARIKDADTFDAWAQKWLRGYQMADSTRDMRRSVYERELLPTFGKLKLQEIGHEDVRALTDRIVSLSVGHLPPLYMRVNLCCKSSAGRLSVARRSRTRQSWCLQPASPDLSRVTEH